LASKLVTTHKKPLKTFTAECAENAEGILIYLKNQIVSYFSLFPTTYPDLISALLALFRGKPLNAKPIEII